MNVLVSSAGRRGALMRLVREMVRMKGGRAYGVDAAPWSAACRLADGWQLVPRFDDASFFDAIADVCYRHKIRTVIPTHDGELLVYATMRPLFEELGIFVGCSGVVTTEIASDKLLTYRFLTQHGLPTVEWIDVDASPNLDHLPYPLVVKPRQGSCSQGVHIVTDREELEFYYRRTVNPIVQQLAVGEEYTINLFADANGKCLVAVPHHRVETRGGEVSKCITRRNPVLIELAHELCHALPDARGPLCFQAFLDGNGQAKIIEINARFGGGYPIAHRAGANFIRLLIEQSQGLAHTHHFNDWIDGLAMTRWDDAVFWETARRRCA